MKPVLAFLVLLSLFCAGNADNITKILNGFSDYSIFNSYLSQTKLADEINSRSTITVLALNNGAMSALTSKRLGLSVIKKVLSLHVLLDYFDGQKLHEISNGTMISTTLYQTSGNAVGKSGFLNITVLKGGKVAFGAAATAGAKLDSMFVKSIKEDPYNMSVLEISNAIMPSDLSTAPAPSPNDINITALLEKAGCKIFVQMITATGVLKTYQDALAKGFTLFAPTDGAFTGTLMRKFKKLSSAQEVSILEYHALPSYNPLGTLKTTSAPITTLATNGASKYALSVSSSGDTVILNTGLAKSTISSTLLDDQPVVLYTINGVLLPMEIFGVAPANAPAPALAPLSTPSSTPTPSPTTPTPTPETAISPTPSVSAPLLSPPAPPTVSPAEGPTVGGPTAGKSSASFAAALESNVAFGSLASLALLYWALMFML